MPSGKSGRVDGVDRLLAGRYRVVARLGRGGMGVVWRAVDEVLGREVAVKELRTFTDAHGPELADLRLRMQREARAAARVRHPGVVAVHDIAEVDGRPLIVMELIDGPSLDDVLGERGPIDPREAAGIGAKVMEALTAAHAVGVLHRDVKPGNILLDRSGRVVLTDFGIATMDDPGDGSATHLTRSGELIGSLDYLAPERAQGADPGPASDVWALGATLYAAVEGASPFRRTSTYSTLTAIVSEPLPEPRRAGRLGPVLRQLMEKRAELRPGADVAWGLLEEVAGAPGVDLPTAVLRGNGGGGPAVPPGFVAAGARGSAGTGAGVPEPEESTGVRAAGVGASGVALGEADLDTGAGVLGADSAEPTESGQGLGAVRHAAPAGQGFGADGPAGGGGPETGGSSEQAGPEETGSGASGRSGSGGPIPGSSGPLETTGYGSDAAGRSGRGGSTPVPSWPLEALAYGSAATAPSGPGGSTPGSPRLLEASAYGAAAAGPSGSGEQGPGFSGRPASHAHPPTSASPATPMPQGFGPPLAFVASAPQSSPPTGPMADPTTPRRKVRILMAAAVVAAVLAGAGVVVARMANSGDTTVTSQPSDSPPAGAGGGTGPASPDGRKDTHPSADPEPTGQGDDGTQAPTRQHTGKGKSTAPGQAPTVAPSKSTSSGGGNTGGSAPATGGSSPSPVSACESIGGGKYNCQVWRSAKSYTASGTEVGVLGAGTNYVFCQENLGRRETYGQWTNTWWAKTDDDSGNTNVYVSDVYLKGGDNDEPVPGVPVC
ncbi:protein kinase [Streptomyces sp. NPDC048504]|uniref:serine/threonine-protein kinase n=1 Tax=Streptomyces sp. NPDC048504 TaxID=3365559 RepID=UPI00371443B1